jgi:hypothetical protein
MITLNPTESDDPAFVELITNVLNGSVLRYKPTEIYVVQINGWFDHKWLAFSGKVMGAFGVASNQLTLPPFHPHRVIRQTYFRVDSPRLGQHKTLPAEALHIDQWSESNLSRLVQHVSRDGLFLWYSSNTKGGDRASVLVYNTNAGCDIAWYVSLKKDGEWRVNRVKDT